MPRAELGTARPTRQGSTCYEMLHFRAFYPHPANKSALRRKGQAEGSTHFMAPNVPLASVPLPPAPRPTPHDARTSGFRPGTDLPPLATA